MFNTFTYKEKKRSPSFGNSTLVRARSMYTSQNYPRENKNKIYCTLQHETRKEIIPFLIS